MATETTESFTTCVGEAGKAIGLPQLCGDWFANQIFWLAVAMVAIYFILSRMALPRISAVLAERAGAISRDIAAAEELKKKALDAEAAYDKALADARVAAAKIVAGAKADIQAGLDAELKKADVQIGKKTAESEKAIADIRAGAVKSVAEVAKDTAAALVAALGGSADTKTVNAAVTARMKG